MRRLIRFDCEGARLAGTIDEAPGRTGLLIVSGGNEIRIGAHRGMAKLAAEIAAAGHPVLRFDRRGIGDSEGANGGFHSSGPDIAAAVAAFRAACPAIDRIVAFGNCDAASALVLHRIAGIDALLLANPWVIERADDLPAPAAIRAHYWSRLRDPRALIGLFTGAIDLGKLARGVLRVARSQEKSSLSQSVADGIAQFPGAVSVLLASRDGTAIAFAEEWARPHFAEARKCAKIEKIDSASHSFASAEDYRALKTLILEMLA